MFREVLIDLRLGILLQSSPVYNGVHMIELGGISFLDSTQVIVSMRAVKFFQFVI